MTLMTVVTVLIVTYDSAGRIAACLGSLPTDPAGSGLEVIVVDNASRDGSADVVGRDFPGVRLIALERNIGFGPACNLGSREAEGEFLLFMNPDTVLHPGKLEEFLTFARRHPEHGLYGGRAVDPTGSILWNSCWGFPSLWSLVCFATCLSTAFSRTRLFDPESLGGWARNSVRQVDAVTGYLTLIRRSVFEQLHGFDTRYFLYGEDLDLCMRARRAGYRAIHFPRTILTHFEGCSTPDWADRMTLILQGKVTFLRRHWVPWRRRLGVALYQAGVGLRALLGSASWRTVWHRRAEWSRGYQEPGS